MKKNPRAIAVSEYVISVGVSLIEWSHKISTIDPNDWYAAHMEIAEEMLTYAEMARVIVEAYPLLLTRLFVEVPDSIEIVPGVKGQSRKAEKESEQDYPLSSDERGTRFES